jgi:tetratricopeptide (TPR) repeat protein
MRQVLPQLVAAYRRVEERGAASPEVDYAMGRMYRALLDEGRAMAHQERALTRDPAYADALYERAVLRSRRYGRELTQTLSELRVERGGGDPAVADMADTAERARPALGRLRVLIVEDWTRLEALAPSQARTLAARGILAFHRGRLDEARALLGRAVAADPLIEEAWETLARAHAVAHRSEEAEETYTRALAADRGYAPHLVGRCEVRLLLGRESEAVADADHALVIDPGSTGARLCRAESGLKRGHREIMSGGDAREALDGAERDFTEVLRHEEVPFALLSRGIVRRYRGMFLERHGKDPLPDFAASEADFTRGIRSGPHPSEHWANRSRLRSRRALHFIESGQDAGAELDAAQGDLEQALRLDPAAALATDVWMGEVQAYRGLQALRRGQPAEAHFAAAEASYNRGDTPGNDGWVQLHRGTMCTWRGIERARAGGDPLPVWAAAEKDLDHAVQTFPRYTDPLVRRGILHLERARHLGDRRERERGLADLRRALAQEPDHREALDALRR